ncbi:MAG TPA: hypothetical protein VF137_10905 [Candidatus Dormibacteraeota bacterium]
MSVGRLATTLGLIAVTLLAACGPHPPAGGLAASASPSASPSALATGLPALKYDLIARFGPPAFCDPDSYPIAHDVTPAEVHQRLLSVQATDAATYQAILAHHQFGGALTAAQELVVYQDYKALRSITLTGGGADFRFAYSARGGQIAMQGTRYTGRIDGGGSITVQSQAPALLRCPICLARADLIDTPSGPIPVTRVRVGMLVYSRDAAGRRLPEPVMATSSMEAPPWHEMDVVLLSDGRAVEASPGHPTADGRYLGQLAPGDELDGAHVLSISLVAYSDGRTYDLLPAGPTGDYWVDGVLLASTLR